MLKVKKKSYQEGFKEMLDDMIYGKPYNGRISDIRGHWGAFIEEYETPWWKKLFRVFKRQYWQRGGF